MSKILYFENLSGIAGDMTIGALLDLGADFDTLVKELKKLNLDGYELSIEKKAKNGIYGTKFDVILTDNHTHEHHEHKHEHHDHNHEHHDHTHEHHDHTHEHKHEHHDHLHEHHDHSHHHDSHAHNLKHHHELHVHSHGRNYGEIKKMINDSSLSDYVKELSIKIFEEVATAEAKIHNTTKDQVHFHEVGAVDSIIDIVGTAILIEMLGIDEVYSAPVHVGTGFVKCDHGKIPVPAPATLEILKGVPIYSKGIRSELVTPTGAAIIKALAKDFIPRPEMIIEEIGYGLGTKDLEIANLLRVNLYKKKTNNQLFMIETNIDDMSSEIFSYLMDALLKYSLDVFYTPIQMKKNRPAVKLSALVTEENIEIVEKMILKETTSFGVRKYAVDRTILERESIIIDTLYGPLKIKHGYLNGECIKATPEYEDCKRIAMEQNLPLRDVYQQILIDIKNN